MPTDNTELIACVRAALEEDIGDGDVSADLIATDTQAIGHLWVREPAILCGRPWFEQVFFQVEPRIDIEWLAAEGDAIAPDSLVCRLSGPARGMLTAERTALNFLQTLSGTATETGRWVALLAGTSTRLLDTRKTLPGLRKAQKYAVVCGGGHNHRFGLYDAVMLKENHLASAGSIRAAVHAARTLHPSLPLIVEVETLAQLDEALAVDVEHILLDNMALDQLKSAVALTAGRAKLEASGNIGRHNLQQIAATGVDFVSVGALTKHVQAIDFSLRLETR